MCSKCGGVFLTVNIVDCYLSVWCLHRFWLNIGLTSGNQKIDHCHYREHTHKIFCDYQHILKQGLLLHFSLQMPYFRFKHILDETGKGMIHRYFMIRSWSLFGYLSILFSLLFLCLSRFSNYLLSLYSCLHTFLHTWKITVEFSGCKKTLLLLKNSAGCVFLLRSQKLLCFWTHTLHDLGPNSAKVLKDVPIYKQGVVPLKLCKSNEARGMYLNTLPNILIFSEELCFCLVWKRCFWNKSFRGLKIA